MLYTNLQLIAGLHHESAGHRRGHYKTDTCDVGGAVAPEARRGEHRLRALGDGFIPGRDGDHGGHARGDLRREAGAAQVRQAPVQALRQHPLQDLQNLSRRLTFVLTTYTR